MADQVFYMTDDPNHQFTFLERQVKNIRYVKANAITARSVRFSGCVMLLLALVMFIMGVVSWAKFHTVNTVVFVLAWIVSWIMMGLSIVSVARPGFIVEKLKRVDETTQTRFSVMVAAMLLVLMLAILTGFFYGVLILGVIFVLAIIVFVIENRKHLRSTGTVDFEQVDSTLPAYVISTNGDKHVDEIKVHEEEAVFTIEEEAPLSNDWSIKQKMFVCDSCKNINPHVTVCEHASTTVDSGSSH